MGTRQDASASLASLLGIMPALRSSAGAVAAPPLSLNVVPVTGCGVG